LVVVLALAVVVVRSQNAQFNEVVAASELASLAVEVNELDQALGEEALAATEVITNPAMWEEFLADYAAQTDERVIALETRANQSAVEGLSEAVTIVDEVLAYREDVPNGLVTPLQLADRYGEPRSALIDVLEQNELDGVFSRLTALIETRSAHLDERFSSQLALRYGRWEPGQYSNTTAAIAIQRDRIEIANSFDGESVQVSQDTLTNFRSEVAMGREIPDIGEPSYALASDAWLVALNGAIQVETDSIDQQLGVRADEATRARTLTILGVLLGAVLAFAAAGLISYRIVSRLQRLTIFAGRVADGERELGRVSADVQGTDELADLARVVDEMVDEVRQRDQRLATQARTDDLTGMLNRRAILQQWRQLVSQVSGSAFALAVDLDGFKAINDQYGHQAGDAILVEAAKRLRAAIGERKATGGRVGGDEFLLVLSTPEANDIKTALEFGDSMLAALREPFEVEGKQVCLCASVGLVERRPGKSATELLQEADHAMYAVKSEGGDGVCEADEHLRRSIAQFAAERAAVRQAVENEDFIGAFQPIVDAGGEIMGFEVLARWRVSEGLLSGAEKFLDVLTHERLFPELDQLMLKRACEALVSWDPDPQARLVLSVNVSTEFLERSDFVETVLNLIDSHGVDRERIMLEITESGIMHDAVSNAAKLAELRQAGLSVAIDDYGTGYSSLSYLQRLPIDFVKLDRQFVDHVDQNTTSQAIARSVLTLAADLNVSCIVEGVERREEHEWFVNQGADFVQGYLHGKPGSGELAQELFNDRHLVSAGMANMS